MEPNRIERNQTERNGMEERTDLTGKTERNGKGTVTETETETGTFFTATVHVHV